MCKFANCGLSSQSCKNKYLCPNTAESYFATAAGAVTGAAGLTITARLSALFASDLTDALLIGLVVSSLSLATGLSAGAAPLGEILLRLASFCFSSALKAW